MPNITDQLPSEVNLKHNALVADLNARIPTKKAKYYDQIAWFKDAVGIPALSMNYLQGGNYDFVPLLWDSATTSRTRFSWKMSDHYPLWVEFDVMT